MISLGLIGYPLHHSLSPIIHTAALECCGIKGEYSLFPIPPEDRQGIKVLIDRVRDGEITGLNVTIPYKRSVISLMDVITPTAQAIGAVNTIFVQNGKLSADNTDAQGFLMDMNKFLEVKAGGFGQSKHALVLGAGGAARAVTFALINDGWEVILAARRKEQAQKLIEHFPNNKLCLSSIDFQSDSFKSMDPDVHLVINTTPVGMSPSIGNSPWPLNIPFPSEAVIYDLVYNPRETKFVQDARAEGLTAISGLGMLVEQAALAFEIWTGCNVPRDVLVDSLEEK
jgi:shikimate dehydrogenase